MTLLLSSTYVKKNFDNFPLFDETLRHKELCISVFIIIRVLFPTLLNLMRQYLKILVFLLSLFAICQMVCILHNPDYRAGFSLSAPMNRLEVMLPH